MPLSSSTGTERIWPKKRRTVTGRVQDLGVEPDTHRPVLQTDRGADQQEYDRRFYAIVTDLIGTPTRSSPRRGRSHGGPGPRCGAWTRGRHAPATSTVHCGHSQASISTKRVAGTITSTVTTIPRRLSTPTPDPLGLLPEDNQHSYARNPLSWLDALGLAPCAKVIALRAWKARNNQGGYSVYHGLDSQGRKIYAEITNNIARRERQHIAKELWDREAPGGPWSYRPQVAGACDRAGPHRGCQGLGLSRARNGVSIPQINSIAPKRLIYGTAVRYGRIFLS
ncbi:hypothetical protein STENM327S_06742 [Streptomyces tendae]